MPAEQLESALDDPEMRDAVAVLFERTDGGTEELQWADVKDALSSGEWGRLIESGVLVGGGNGFTFADPDRARALLDDSSRGAAADAEGAGSTPDSPSWAWYDKAAGLSALGLFTGYWSPHVRDLIASVDDVVLAPVTHALPFYVVVLLLAAATGLYSTLLQARLMDTEKMAAYKDRMERLNDRKKAAKERGDDEALEELRAEQLEAAGDQVGMFKLQFRPMVWIMLLTIPVFLWLRWKVRGGHLGVGQGGLVVPLAGAVTWQQPLFGPMSTWIVWYFLCSVASRQVVQKTFDVQTTPS